MSLPGAPHLQRVDDVLQLDGLDIGVATLRTTVTGLRPEVDLRALGTAQIVALSTTQIDALDTAQLAGLSTRQVAVEY